MARARTQPENETPEEPAPIPAPGPAGPPPTPHLRRSGRLEQLYVPSKNVPGELLKIDKDQLSVDAAYQRRLDWGRVSRMASNWNWVACGALIVSTRDENYTLVDGQHRWEAAKMLDDIRDLPCLCFPLESLRDEAIGFLASNVEKKLPSLADQFRALVIAENENARVADRLAHRAGRHIAGGTGPWTISCASEFLRLIQNERAAVEAAWDTIARVCEGHPMPMKIMRGIVTLQSRLPANQSLSGPWGDRIVRIGYHRIMDEITRMGGLNRNFGPRACAEGVLAAINRGMRGNLLEVTWPRDPRAGR